MTATMLTEAERAHALRQCLADLERTLATLDDLGFQLAAAKLTLGIDQLACDHAALTAKSNSLET